MSVVESQHQPSLQLICGKLTQAWYLSLQEFQQLQAQLDHQNSTTAFYLLQRLGPASFIIGQSADAEHAHAKYKVTLGNLPSCSCL